MKRNVAVFGDGGWGTTIAVLLAKKGYAVTLWGVFPDHIALLKKERLNRTFLPGIELPKEIELVSDIEKVPRDAVNVFAIPTQYLRKAIVAFRGMVKKDVVSLTKGIEEETLKRPSEVIEEVLDIKDVVVMSGPSISFEVARKIPTTVVAAGKNEKLLSDIQAIFSTEYFRVYTSKDIVGVEIGGALKNIIAIAAGASDGMGFGTNTKAALLTRGLVEIVRLGVRLGAQKETFFGLSGLGDLATTCMSAHSRNRWLGEEIGKGKKAKDVLKKTEMVVEGVATTRSAYELSKKLAVEMPITEKIYEVLYEGKDLKKAVFELMTRTLKAEGI